MIATGLFHNGIRISYFKCVHLESDWHPNQCRLECEGPNFEARGLFYGGGWDLLGVQTYGTLAIIGWGAVWVTICLWCIENLLKLPCRVTLRTEMSGLDVAEHGYDINGKLVKAMHASDIGSKLKSLTSRSAFEEMRKKIVKANWKAAITNVMSLNRASSSVKKTFKLKGGGGGVTAEASAAVVADIYTRSSGSAAGANTKHGDETPSQDKTCTSSEERATWGGGLRRLWRRNQKSAGADDTAANTAANLVSKSDWTRSQSEMNDELASLRSEVKTLRDMIKAGGSQ